MVEVLYENALDETFTVATAGLSDSDAEDRNTITMEYTERVEINGVSNELLEVHGVSPGKKPDGVTRLIYENPNGFNSRIGGNEKLEKAMEIMNVMTIIKFDRSMV